MSSPLRDTTTPLSLGANILLSLELLRDSLTAAASLRISYSQRIATIKHGGTVVKTSTRSSSMAVVIVKDRH